MLKGVIPPPINDFALSLKSFLGFTHNFKTVQIAKDNGTGCTQHRQVSETIHVAYTASLISGMSVAGARSNSKRLQITIRSDVTLGGVSTVEYC